MDQINYIKTAIHTAAAVSQKIAMFHFQVLKNANELQGMNAEAFCKEVAVPASYRTEFTKMIGLARLMEEQGIRLTSI
jgi:hypothetical protein